MIRDFWVKNYLSIRDKQELSFVVGKMIVNKFRSMNRMGRLLMVV